MKIEHRERRSRDKKGKEKCRSIFEPLSSIVGGNIDDEDKSRKNVVEVFNIALKY